MQQTRSTKPTKVPLQNVPVGAPWETIAIDILEVPMSYQHNRYLLVIQDYFTKWATAIPIPDQTAAVVTQELMKVFAIVYSDQGRNFESTMLLEAFGIHKTWTTAYHPKGDGMVERFNRTHNLGTRLILGETYIIYELYLTIK